ncbi:MAG: hypothetical protein II948_11420 [Synergistaceae bacterium]|nr:hypothetical protein [Synergistaceae bacterium]MBQ9896818.1 hypothetical protein [Synergistaceae bacterium]
MSCLDAYRDKSKKAKPRDKEYMFRDGHRVWLLVKPYGKTIDIFFIVILYRL